VPLLGEQQKYYREPGVSGLGPYIGCYIYQLGAQMVFLRESEEKTRVVDSFLSLMKLL
jgi:hypothetical protein